MANLRKIHSYIGNVTVPDFGYRKRKHKDTEEVREHPKAESGNPDGVNKQNAYSASMNQNGVEETDGNTKSKKKQKDKKRKEQMKAR